MRIRIIVRYYLTLIRMATIKRTTEKFWKVYGENKTFSALLVGMKFGAAITENRTQILQKKVVIQRKQKQKNEKLYEPLCLLHHCLQYSRHGNGLSVYQ